LNSDVVAARYSQALIELQNRSGIERAQLVGHLERVAKQVDQWIARDEFDRVFKGKWYPTLFEAEIRSVARGKQIHEAGIASRLVEVLLMTLDFDRSWADDFKGPLRTLVAKL
jgi:hypothetical protein